MTVIALDVGGTGIKSALVRRTGEVVHAQRCPTDAHRGADAVVETVLELAERLDATARAKGLEPVAAGVVVPGVVDETAGVAVWSANVGFRDVPLRDLVSARLGLPATLGHDVRAGGLAEARLGAARGLDHVLFVAVGTGIAAAHVVNGRAHSGAHGAASEIGHVVVRPDGPRCRCGARGCLESVASAAALERRYAALTGVTATAADVCARAADGEPAASAAWREIVEALADGLVTAQALLDPAVIVLGGGLAEAGEALLTPLRAAVRARLTFHREPVLARAALGDEAGCLGAALLALDGVGLTGPVGA
jgi:glucokinase